MTRRRGAVSLLVLASACATSGTPRLDVSTAAPAVSTPAGVEIGFQVRNAGTGRLRLQALVGDCACQATIAGADVLGPGERATIEARCRVVPGARDLRRLRLHSNDPEHPVQSLAVPVPAAGAPARPAAVSFGYVRVGEMAVREVVVPHAPSSVALRTGSGAFTLEPGARGRDGTRTFRVRFAPGVPGVARATLDRGTAASPIAVSGVGFAAVAAYPAEVRLPSTVAEDLPPLLLKNLTDDPIDIVRVEFPPTVTGEVQTVVPGEEFRIRLRGAGRAGARGVITVHTTAAAAPLVLVPVIDARAPGEPGA